MSIFFLLGWITSSLTLHMFKFFFFCFKSWSNGMTTKQDYFFMTLILGNDVTYTVIRFHFFVYFLFCHVELKFSCILIFDSKVFESFIQECLMGVWGAKLGQNWGVMAKSLKTRKGKFWGWIKGCFESLFEVWNKTKLEVLCLSKYGENYGFFEALFLG